MFKKNQPSLVVDMNWTFFLIMVNKNITVGTTGSAAERWNGDYF